MFIIYLHVTGFPEELAGSTDFDWDAGNAGKNRERHQVSDGECERVFFQRPILIAPYTLHSRDEPRYAALGQTAAGRRLTIVFTIRGEAIRVISARPMSRRERRVNEQA
ncbi:MAG: BrnT family toxin [Gemmatimonadota bacterium]